MPVLRLTSAAVVGVSALPVDVEIDVSWGLPAFNIVGLPDAAIRESRDRVRSAIKNSGYEVPEERITINLAPADIKKAGSSYDLAIAIGLLAVVGQIPKERISKYVFAAELGLDGKLRPLRGALPIAAMTSQLARDGNVDGLIVAPGNVVEATIVDDIKVCTATTLEELITNIMEGRLEPQSHVPDANPVTALQPDLAEVKGHSLAKRALEIAAAGRHNILMVGPPGSGKTMLAKRLPGLLPELSFGEALETTTIHSVAGVLATGTLIRERPFRSPHHSVSDAGLIGGGTIPRPGEVSLAHNGVLFLDELPEFRKNALEVLRQPLEDHQVTLARAALSLTFPARIMLVAAMNPSAAGGWDSPRAQQEKYQAKLSGPLLDRIDLHVEVDAVPYDDLASKDRSAESSQTVRQRVAEARTIQQDRFADHAAGFCNADMTAAMIEDHCQLPPEADSLMRRAVESLGMSARGYARIRKLARTIADLDQQANIQVNHIAEAIGFRTLDRNR